MSAQTQLAAALDFTGWNASEQCACYGVASITVLRGATLQLDHTDRPRGETPFLTPFGLPAAKIPTASFRKNHSELR